MLRIFVVAALTGCTVEDSATVEIMTPKEDEIITGDVELTLKGHLLPTAPGTVIIVDNMPYTGGIFLNTIPESCPDECTFHIAFDGTGIPNGGHAIKIRVTDGETPIAGDQVVLEFERP